MIDFNERHRDRVLPYFGHELMLASQAHAESGGNDQEIALLRQQLRLLEQKLDKLQKQTSANTTAAANANAKVDATAKVANANAAYPAKGPVAPPANAAVVTMPNNRPTICTADGQNCVAITGRIHFDGGEMAVGGVQALHAAGLTDDPVEHASLLERAGQMAYASGGLERARLGTAWALVGGRAPLAALARRLWYTYGRLS